MKRPRNWRKGQTIFNFLEYLRIKGYATNQNKRLADTFYISDEDWDSEYKEFLNTNKSI